MSLFVKVYIYIIANKRDVWTCEVVVMNSTWMLSQCNWGLDLVGELEGELVCVDCEPNGSNWSNSQ